MTAVRERPGAPTVHFIPNLPGTPLGTRGCGQTDASPASVYPGDVTCLGCLEYIRTAHP